MQRQTLAIFIDFNADFLIKHNADIRFDERLTIYIGVKCQFCHRRNHIKRFNLQRYNLLTNISGCILQNQVYIVSSLCLQTRDGKLAFLIHFCRCLTALERIAARHNLRLGFVAVERYRATLPVIGRNRIGVTALDGNPVNGCILIDAVFHIDRFFFCIIRFRIVFVKLRRCSITGCKAELFDARHIYTVRQNKIHIIRGLFCQSIDRDKVRLILLHIHLAVCALDMTTHGLCAQFVCGWCGQSLLINSIINRTGLGRNRLNRCKVIGSALICIVIVV